MAQEQNNFANYYSCLDFDDALSVDEENPVQVQSSKKPRVPPVVLPNLLKHEVLALLNCNNIVKFNLKLMSIGIKVFFDEASDRELFITALKSNKASFFTYASKESRPVKFVLSGLDYYATQAIFDELNNKGVPCAEVKQIKLRNERFNSQTNYSVYFKKGVTSFCELKKCNTLFNTIIKWSPWRRNKNLVTQCRRCQMFGHGEDHCHLPVKCQKCTGNHSASNCNISRIKCTNCGECHMASDPSCPKRAEYLNILDKVRLRSRSNRRPNPNFEFNTNGNGFPSLLREPRHDVQNNAAHNTFASRTNGISYASITKNNNNLFCADELISITRELLTSLRGAKSKEEQIMAIAALVTKFVYNV